MFMAESCACRSTERPSSAAVILVNWDMGTAEIKHRECESLIFDRSRDMFCFYLQPGSASAALTQKPFPAHCKLQ